MTRRRWPLVLALEALPWVDWGLVIGWTWACALWLDPAVGIPASLLAVVVNRYVWGRLVLRWQCDLAVLLAATDRLRVAERGVAVRVGRGEKPEGVAAELRWCGDWMDPTVEQVRAIRATAPDVSAAALGRTYGVSRTHIHRLRKDSKCRKLV